MKQSNSNDAVEIEEQLPSLQGPKDIGSPSAITYILDNDSSIINIDHQHIYSDSNDSVKQSLGHCHIDNWLPVVDKRSRLKLVVASLLCLIFMVGEITGGVMAHSLAVVSDAAHLLTDFASFMISLVALHLVSRPATKRLSFGWHRAEILGALVSILMLWIITGILVYSATIRIRSGDYEIDATIMLITSSVGVAFNIVLGCTLHQHSHSHDIGGLEHSHGVIVEGHSTEIGVTVGDCEQVIIDTDDATVRLVDPSNQDSPFNGAKNYGSIATDTSDPLGVPALERKNRRSKSASNVNVRAAFVHVLGDFLQSIGVLVAACIIYFKPEWKIVDPVCTFLFSIFVLITTISIMQDILIVLMEGTPRNINFEEVRDTMLEMDGVKDLHDLHLWSLTMSKTAMSVHLAVDTGVDPMQVVSQMSRLIQRKYNISQTTMQVETYVSEMNDCRQCQGLKD